MSGPFTLEQAQTLEEAERGLRIVPLERRRPQQLRNVDGQRDAGKLHPKRSAVGWRDLARPKRRHYWMRPTHFLALYRQEGPDAVAEAVFV